MLSNLNVNQTSATAIQNHGIIVNCRYGLEHLVCLPINRPTDPLMSPPLVHLTAGDGYFAEQFFLTMHTSLNRPNIISTIYHYALQSLNVEQHQDEQTMSSELAQLVKQNKLLIIPLYD